MPKPNLLRLAVEPRGTLDPAELMQEDPGRAATTVDLEVELGVHDLEKEITLGLSKNVICRLARQLSVKVGVLTADRQRNVRRELIAANIRIELLRIQGDLGAL